MGRSQETFNKKEIRSKKEKKRKEKAEKRQARKENAQKKGFDDMIAYVDANGNITSTPPDPNEKEEIDVSQIDVSVPKSQPTEDDDETRTGILNFFNDSKGYGFINDINSKEKIFVHINNFVDDIQEGDKVSFEVEMGPRGLSAINVKLFNKET